MSRPRHPNKEIEAAVRYAESLGWRFRKGHGHVWGYLYCTLSSRGGCRVRVDSTPRSPENYARGVRRRIDKCPHQPRSGAAGQETGEEE